MLTIYIQQSVKRIEHYVQARFIQGIQGQFNEVCALSRYV